MTIRKMKDGSGAKRGALGKYMPGAGVVQGDGWGDQADIGTNPKGCGKYTSDDVSFLTGKASDTPRFNTQAKERDIFDEVEGQSSDSGNRAVRSRGQP
jgi:hypothetical protein